MMSKHVQVIATIHSSIVHCCVVGSFYRWILSIEIVAIEEKDPNTLFKLTHQQLSCKTSVHKMKTTIVVVFFLSLTWSAVLINAQSSLICNKISEFTSCVNKYSLNIAGCSASVKSTPGLAYYECQCEQYTAMDQCYSLCPDDAQIQLQFDTQKRTKNSICQAVTDLKNQGFTNTSSSSTKTSTKTTSSQASTSSVESSRSTSQSATTTTTQSSASTKADTKATTASSASTATAMSSTSKSITPQGTINVNLSQAKSDVQVQTAKFAVICVISLMLLWL